MAGAVAAPHRLRTGRRPSCASRGRPPASTCPLFDACPRWHGQPDDHTAALAETTEQTEPRRAGWPCTRLLDLLGPTTGRIG